jgi:hypothetical protein
VREKHLFTDRTPKEAARKERIDCDTDSVLSVDTGKLPFPFRKYNAVLSSKPLVFGHKIYSNKNTIKKNTK